MKATTMETKPGVFGVIGTAITGLFSFLVKHEPEIRVLSLLASIVLAIVTTVYYVRKARRESK